MCKRFRLGKSSQKSPQGENELASRGRYRDLLGYFFAVPTGFFSGVVGLLIFTGAVVLPGDATGEADGDASGLAAGDAVATGVAVFMLFVPPLLAGALLHAPKTAIAAKTELMINDLLIFLLVPSSG